MTDGLEWITETCRYKLFSMLRTEKLKIKSEKWKWKLIAKMKVSWKIWISLNDKWLQIKVGELSKTIISLCSQKLSGIKFVCNFSGWAGRISIYKIRVNKKCDVFFQKQNGESNTDPVIILRRLHNLSAR